MTNEEYFNLLDSRYSLSNKPIACYNKDNGCVTDSNIAGRVINSFTTQLMDYLKHSMMNGKIPQILHSNHITYEQLSVVDNMLENYCDLQAYVANPKVRTIEKEIAVYRSCVYRGSKEAIIEDSNVTRTLFLEYMLKAFVCYIEFFNPATGVVRKCIGTRNVDLIAGFLNLDDTKINNLKQGLEMRYEDIKLGEIGVYPLKVDKKAESRGVLTFSGVGRKITFNTSGTILRIMPVSQLVSLTRYLLIGKDMIASDFVQVVYLKDNCEIRSIVSTGNVNKLTSIYGDVDIAKELSADCKISWERGYIQVPDVERAVNDYGCRAINIGRLIRINKLPNYVASPYIRIDLNGVVETFKTYLMSYATNYETLMLIGTQLGIAGFNEPDTVPNATSALELIKSWLVMKNLKSGELRDFQIALHTYMLANPQLYNMYSGIIV